MSNGSGNISNVLNLGGFNATPGGLVIPEANTQGYFGLYAGLTSGTNTYAPFIKNGTIYQVTPGKICYVVGFAFLSGTVGDRCQLISATATFANGASTLTGAIYQGGAPGGTGGFYIYDIQTAYVPVQSFFPYQFASETYPGFQGTAANTSVILLCKEAQ
jgi:hypothetical protein